MRNYDGDIITVDSPDWPDIVGDNIGIRIAGIDTPELRGTSGALDIFRNLCFQREWRNHTTEGKN